ncbi:Uncharacterised protein [Streptococcus pneumoniae]|nr:Uncharacterised protein [Streptococcus pneumoniae]CGG23427.1 Uncharacterised protein [Streptococcus pneumoniae]CIP85174.1 Uncharacterised protein [Streptococcus pneumoniae]CIP88115.1 Uncharacterised protein [Streptococcus pneumoniae]CIQ71284.1 Uncharacterised protein [Streptococcus pneumoniae]
MKKSLFRIGERCELFNCYSICFACNLLLDYAKTKENEFYFLKNTLKSLYEYQFILVLLFTVVVIVFQHQLLSRKKVEIYCRVLVGDTKQLIIIRYLLDSFLLLCCSFFITVGISLVTHIQCRNSFYLFCLLLLYTLISLRKVGKI